MVKPQKSKNENINLWEKMMGSVYWAAIKTSPFQHLGTVSFHRCVRGLVLTCIHFRLKIKHAYNQVESERFGFD